MGTFEEKKVALWELMFTKCLCDSYFNAAVHSLKIKKLI